jgi:NADH dehydrogenase
LEAVSGRPAERAADGGEGARAPDYNPARRTASGASMDPRTTTLFATGVSGFIGRALLARLAPRRVPDGKAERPTRIVGLSRNVTAMSQPNVELVRGDLDDPRSYAEHLEGVGVVLHAAAATGKRRPEEYERVNVEGTRKLLEACRRAGVGHFRYVSSIAAGYPDLERYPYGRSKRAAEELVRSSGLGWSILRPTIVLGRRSALWESLRALACLPLIPVFGSGAAEVQPIHVDDLCDLLADWTFDEALEGETLEAGGPEALPIEELLRRIRAAVKGGRGRVVHLPLAPTLGLLRGLEGPLFGVLPLTAGQLYAFAYDSTAAPNALLARHQAGMRGVDALIAELARG